MKMTSRNTKTRPVKNGFRWRQTDDVSSCHAINFTLTSRYSLILMVVSVFFQTWFWESIYKTKNELTSSRIDEKSLLKVIDFHLAILKFSDLENAMSSCKFKSLNLLVLHFIDSSVDTVRTIRVLDIHNEIDTRTRCALNKLMNVYQLA